MGKETVPDWKVEFNIKFDVKKIKYVVACSGGNDSIALIEFMIEYCKKRNEKFLVLYNDTGWAREDWPARISKIKDMLTEREIPFATTLSIGFEELVRSKKGFPMPASNMQFCTASLKTGPTLGFLKSIDPDGDMIVVTGRRRAESNNRAGLAMREEETIVYKGRDVFNPLVEFDEEKRDVFIRKFGLEPLPHSSMECFPCVCSKKEDLVSLLKYPERIIEIQNIEVSMGHTREGKPRTMFRPYRSGGGVGIQSVIKWASGGRGTKINEIPEEYRLPKVDYSAYRGNMKPEERALFWADIKRQCVDLGYDLKNLSTDIAYDDESEEGREFARQCDGGLCGN